MIKSVRNAFDALNYILENYSRGNGSRLKDIAGHLGIQNSTMRNLLKTMENAGYLQRDESRQYLPGPNCRDMNRICNMLEELQETAAGIISEAAEDSGEDFVLCTFLGNRRRVLQRYSGGSVISVDSELADNTNTYSLVTNRVMLAFSEPEDQQSFFGANGMPGNEWAEAGSMKKMLAALENIRVQGLCGRNQCCFFLHCVSGDERKFSDSGCRLLYP